MLTKFTTIVTIVTTLFCAFTNTSNAQTSVRPYSLVYTETLRGGVVMFGNTSMHILNNNGSVNTTRMNEIGNANNGQGGIGFTQYGNDNSNMQFADVDTDGGTKNSTSADLILPAGTNNIKFARLYWGGRISNSAVNNNPDTLRKIKIRKGALGAYSPAITAATNVDQFTIAGTNERVYQSYVDITDFIRVGGGGTYFVADIAATAGSTSNGGRYAGWSIVVAYENTNRDYYSVRVYDGFSQVYNSGNGGLVTADVTLTGLNVPNNPLAANEAVMSVMAWEGDGNLGATNGNPSGDFIKVNGISVANAANPVTNFWNGSITRNGSYVTTKNPNYFNQMGLDIDEVNVGTGFNIQPNANTVNIQFGTEADQYFPSAFTFAIKAKDPVIELEKTVEDASGDDLLQSNEILTYTLTGTNNGAGSAYNVYVIDTLPSNVTYIAGSMEVVEATGVTPGFKTDAMDADIAEKGFANGKHYLRFNIGNGANGLQGGEMPTGSSFTLRFKVQGGAIPGSVSNTARIVSENLGGESFFDDGTAIIGAAGGPVDVKMATFTATLQNGNGLLKWETENETNNEYFVIERSEDGVRFSDRGTKAGNGTTTTRSRYEFVDPINTTAKIVYYRLKAVDNRGEATYSNIIPLRLQGGMSVDKFNVYPNPFVNNVKITLNSQSAAQVTLRVFSIDGREVINRKVNVLSGDNIIVVNEFDRMQKGNYVVEVSNGTEKFTRKVVKN